MLYGELFLESLDEEIFEEHVSSLVTDKQSNTRGVDDEMELMWQEILAQVLVKLKIIVLFLSAAACNVKGDVYYCIFLVWLKFPEK